MIDKINTERKRMCLNCYFYKIEGASAYCCREGKRYLHYVECFNGWCKHWCKQYFCSKCGATIDEEADGK